MERIRTMRMSLYKLFLILVITLNSNALHACDIKFKLFYTSIYTTTIFSLTPRVYDSGFRQTASDSIIVASDSIIINLLNKIDSLPENKNAAINDLNVRGKIIFYRGGQVFETCYLDAFSILRGDGKIYKIDDRFRKMVDAAIKCQKKDGYMFYRHKTK